MSAMYKVNTKNKYVHNMFTTRVLIITRLSVSCYYLDVTNVTDTRIIRTTMILAKSEMIITIIIMAKFQSSTFNSWEIL